MERAFFYIFHMSLIASLLTITILVLRLLLKKTPKALFCILWGFVAIRLIFPFSPESPFSLIPASLTVTESSLSERIPSSAETNLQEIVFPDAPQTGIQLSDATSTAPEATGEQETILQDITSSEVSTTIPAEPVVTPLPATKTELPAGDAVFLRCATFFASVLWPLGILAMLTYAGISYIRIYKKVKETMPLSDNVFLCDHTATPFILGIIRPRIILPSSIRPEEAEHVIAHEKAHLKRLDHIWKPLGFVLLSFYWFNPVLWIAYIYLCKDIELACDERVIQRMDRDAIKSYSSTLLHYSISRKTVSFCPLAFGEVHVKKRIKNVLHYKRPAFWVIFLAVVSCIAVAVCFLTNPMHKKPTEIAKNPGKLLFLSFTLKDKGSDLTGYEITSDPFLYFTKDNLAAPTIPVQWINHNYIDDLTYEERFDVLRYENGSWISCATEDYIFPEISRLLLRKTTQSVTYSLAGFDLSKDGLYRFRVEPLEGQYLWFDFETVTAYENATVSLPDASLLSITEAVTKDRVSTTGIRTEYPELYDILLANGNATVTCFVDELLAAEKYGLKEFFMAKICSEITGIGLEQGDYDPETWWSTADQWLRIYQNHLAKEKYNELATDEGNQPADTVAEWKNTSLLSATYHPKTPMPRALVWVNYFYNREKNPDGSLIMELPEFPGVTIYADSQEIRADLPDGAQTMITGSTIWTTYLADLNTDSYPEICATVSTEAAPSNLGIVVYDIKNKKTYELRDSDRYSYTLFGDYDSMFVRKIDRTGEEQDFMGKLVLDTDKSNSAVLSLLAVDEALYKSAWVMSYTQIDLTSYSSLYADLALGDSRWTGNDFRPVCYILTTEDWDAFTAAYPEVKVWRNHQILNLKEAFDADVATVMEHCQDEEYSPTFFLSPYGLTMGATSLPRVQGFSVSHKSSTDS